MNDPAEHFEEWLPVVEYEGLYEVSNFGRVRRVAGAFYWRPTGKVLSPQCDRCGYPKVLLSTLEKQRRSLFVHRLVAAAFLGPCPNGLQVHHKDRDRGNASVWNLCYMREIDHKARGEKAGGCTKLDRQKVLEIRRLRLEGVSTLELAKLFHISRSYVYHVVSQRKWDERSMKEE